MVKRPRRIRPRNRKGAFYQRYEPPDKPPGARRRVTLNDACIYSRLGRTTIYGLIKAGALNRYKVGRKKLMIDLDEIDQYLNNLKPAVPAC